MTQYRKWIQQAEASPFVTVKNENIFVQELGPNSLKQYIEIEQSEVPYETTKTKKVYKDDICKFKSRIGNHHKAVPLSESYEILTVPDCLFIGPVVISVVTGREQDPPLKSLFFARNNFKITHPFNSTKVNKFLCRNLLNFDKIR